MIQLDSIVKKFNQFTALNGISLTIPGPGVYGMVGPNGAGKTTTLRIIAGYLAPTAGTASIDGLSHWNEPLKARAKVGYLPESNPLYKDMRVTEFLSFAGAMHSVPARALDERIRNTVKVCGLGGNESFLISQLSKGYRQRVGLAAALIADTEVIILDEPTEGLDPNQRIDIRTLIQTIGKTKTVIVSSHVLPELESICDYLYVINKGTIIAQGSVEELRGALAQRPRLTLKVTAPELPFKTAIQGIPGVIGIPASKTEDGILTITLETDDTPGIKNAVVKVLVDHEWDLVEMSSSQATLQDIFVSLTKG